MPKVALDCGHGINTWNKVTRTGSKGIGDFAEFDFNSATVGYAKLIAEYNGLDIFLTQSLDGNDNDPDMTGVRTRGAANAKCDILISIHADALPNNPDANGHQGFYWGSHAPSQRLATIWAKYAKEHLKNKPRGNGGLTAAVTNGFGDFHMTRVPPRDYNMPSMLIEHAFFTNTYERDNLLKADWWRRQCAIAIVKTLCEYFGMAYRGEPFIPVPKGNVPEAALQPSPQPTPAPPSVVLNPIMGKSVATVEQMVAFVKEKNPNFDPEIAKAFLAVGEKYGIRGDVAFCQAIHETHYFIFDMGTAVTPDQHNYCGLGVTQKGLKGASFATIVDGVTAQMQHLWAYTNKLPLPDGEKLLDPRFNLVTRGIAPGWEDLNGRWAVPGPTYGQTILNYHKKMLEFVPPAPPVVPPSPQPIEELTWQEKAGLDGVKGLADKGLLDNPEYWTKEKMNEPAPTWMIMKLLNKIAK